MREIKFRVLYKPSKTVFHQLKDSPCFGKFEGDNAVSIEDVFFYEPQDFEVMQYTGLKDKNGVEIYEGDILKANQIITKVHWGETGWYETVINSPYNHLRETFKIKDYAKCEVIGNIYENLNLLES